jgi:hypothetical protein
MLQVFLFCHQQLSFESYISDFFVKRAPQTPEEWTLKEMNEQHNESAAMFQFMLSHQ